MKNNKNRFKRGQIVRRKLFGVPIGPYMRVVHTERTRVHVKIIGSNESIITLPKKKIYAYTQNSLPISEELLERLKKETAICVQHAINIPWNKVYNNPPELIRFYTRPKNYEAIFVLEYAKLAYSLNEQVIRIVVGNIII
jgi:hypothetical protein